VEGALASFVRAAAGRPELLDEELLMEIASLAHEAGNLPLASEYWAQAAASGGARAGEARERLYALAIEGDEPGAVRSSVAELRAAQELTLDQLRSAAEAMSRMGDHDAAAGYFTEVLRAGGGYDRDSLLFRLAQLLELPGEARDLKRALSLYEEILRDYPLSRHWDVSSTRTEYLRRHFFDIR
jgi:tetratricopeptide (TPR) repeat protein